MSGPLRWCGVRVECLHAPMARPSGPDDCVAGIRPPAAGVRCSPAVCCAVPFAQSGRRSFSQRSHRRSDLWHCAVGYQETPRAASYAEVAGMSRPKVPNRRLFLTISPSARSRWRYLHGRTVGQGKRKFMESEHGRVAADAMRAIKHALDPLDIMKLRQSAVSRALG